MTISKRQGKNGVKYGVKVYDPATKGKRWVGTYPTLREARAAERAAMSQPVTLVSPAAQDCAAYATWWLEDFKGRRPAASTRKTNRYALRGFIEDFRSVPLASVDRRTAREWTEADIRGRASNARVVQAMFTDAISDGDHPGPNPFAGLARSQRRPRRGLDPDWLTADQLHKLADTALHTCGVFGPQFRALILFAAYVGVRPGELFALERTDVRGDEVAIRQAVGGDGQLKLPKNGKQRLVILPPPARDALRDLVVWPDVPWLFVTPQGSRFSKGSHYTRWNPTRAMFGRPGMDFYELRHFCATHLIDLGVSPADVAIQLGHTDGGRLVMQTYQHASGSGARERLKAAYGSQVASLDRKRGRIRGRKVG